MAKRQTKAAEKKASSVPEDAGSKLVRLELSPAVHQDFRVESAKEGLPMALMARRLVEEWVTKRKAGK